MEKEYLPQRNFSKEERQKWNNRLLDIYKRMRIKSEGGPYDVDFDGLSLTVLPNVYSLLFFSDTLWFAQRLSEIVGSKSLLEIGTGTGAIAILCAKNGANVVATDINPDAVKNARLNAERHKLNISVRQGDMYEPVNKGEKFDFIFWSHPFNNWESPVDDLLLQSGMDYQYKSLKKYIAEAKKYLSRDGKLLLGTGDSADLKTISRFAHENGYTMKLLAEVEIPIEEGGDERIKDLIYEFVPR